MALRIYEREGVYNLGTGYTVFHKKHASSTNRVETELQILSLECPPHSPMVISSRPLINTVGTHIHSYPETERGTPLRPSKVLSERSTTNNGYCEGLGQKGVYLPQKCGQKGVLLYRYCSYGISLPCTFAVLLTLLFSHTGRVSHDSSACSGRSKDSEDVKPSLLTNDSSMNK